MKLGMEKARAKGHRISRPRVTDRKGFKVRYGAILERLTQGQVSRRKAAQELGPRWLEEVLSIISLKDEVDRVKKASQLTQEKLLCMAKAYIDGIFPDEEYHRQKGLLEMELESLVVPAANVTEEAGKLILTIKELWADANLSEHQQLLIAMLDAVYFDTKQTKLLIAAKPKPPFKPIFQIAASKEGSNIPILNEPYLGSSVFLVEAGESRTHNIHILGLLLSLQREMRFSVWDFQ
jgi:site-specific DNA recombinase